MNLFATPYVAWTQNVHAAAKRYYTSMRNSTRDVNRRATFNVWDINSVMVVASTTTAEIQQLIDTAKRDNAWLVLVYHEVKSPEDSEYSITPEKLRADMQLVAGSGIAVVTSAQALQELRPQL
jgi:hypothetical protein